MGVTNDDDEKALLEAAAQEAAMHARVQSWAEPIAERLIDEASKRNYAFPQMFVVPGTTLKESLAQLIGAMTMMTLGEGSSRLLPRSAQEAGTGTLRFRRDATGELCMTIDESPQITQRLCVRDPFVEMLSSYVAPHELIVLACEEIEKALLAGEAFLAAFSYDAASSTPDEAVYLRSPFPGEIEQDRETWAKRDASDASLEAMRMERVAKLTSDVEAIQPGLLARRLLQLGDGVTVDDLEFGLQLLFAQLQTFLCDARQPEDNPVVVLHWDGSVKGAVDIPAQHVIDRLNEDLTEFAPEYSPDRAISISPMGIIRFAVEVCSLIPDHEKDYRLAPDPGGLRLTYANALPSP